MPDVYLGQWEWFTGGRFPHWRPPGGDTVGSIDLRKASDSALAGGLPQGYGLFVYSGPKVGPLLVRSLGNDIEGNLNLAQRVALETSLGLSPGAIVETRLLDVIRELLLSHPDPTGVNKWKPLQGSRLYGVACHLGGWGEIFKEGFSESHPAYSKTIDVFRADYRRSKTNGTDLTSLRKWTGNTLLRLLGRMSDSDAAGLLPSEYASDGWLPPETTITESFNKADSDTLGPDLTWTELDGADWDVISNTAGLSVGNTNFPARADTNLSSDDHYAQVLLADVPEPASGSNMAVILRKDSTTTLTYYHFDAQDGPAWRSWKREAGTYTSIGTDTGDAIAANDVLKGEANDSTMKRYKNGGVLDTTTDTAITGNLRCGISTDRASNRLDSFEAADLAATGHPTMRRWGGVHNMPRTSRRRRGW